MRWILPILITGAVYAQGTKPKQHASEYPVHAMAGQVEVGAEFTVHSFSRGEASYLAPDYLVVDVALYPPKNGALEIDPREFELRINGHKPELLPQPPTMVATSLMHPEWRPGAQVDASMGPIGIDLGQPRQPTNPNPSGSPVPPPGYHDRVPPAQPRPEELVVQTALPTGSHIDAVSGYLYFAYSGRLKSIKTLELLYQGAVLRLR
jgi:hypothetical protein